MCLDIADICGYASISCSSALGATIGRDRISLAIIPALAEDLIQENILGIQTNLERLTICHVPQGDPKNRHTRSASSYADSEHMCEYSDYLAASIFNPT